MIQVTKKRILSVILIMPILIIGATELAIVYDGITETLFDADAALVLATAVFPDGTPSPRLQGRLNRALALYQEGTVAHVVVSGGFGKEGHYEGDVMAAYLVAHGVPEDKIIIDNEGVNTAATARNFARLQEEHDFKSVIVVSQFFHLSRCRLALKQAGVTTIGTAHSRHYEWRDMYGTAREFAGFYVYLWRY
jgi:vancomycin permeability regulator SanA